MMGWIAEHFGPRSAMMLSGAVPALAAVVIALILARSGKLRLKVSLKRRESLVSIVSRRGLARA